MAGVFFRQKSMLRLTILAFLSVIPFVSNAKTPWHFPLYLDGGQPAENRVEISVSNNSDKHIEERVLFIPAKKLGLSGQRRDSVRIVSQRGSELLFSISPYSEIIPEDAVVTIPFDCPPKSKISLWCYFGNARAVEVPDFYPYGIVNEDFEDGEFEVFRRWSDGQITLHDPIEISESEARGGKRSAHIKAGTFGENWSALRRVMQVNEGASYEFTGYAKVKNMLKEKSSNIIGVHFVLYRDSELSFLKRSKDPAKNDLKKIIFSTNTISGNCDWTPMRAKIKVPKGYNRLVVKTKSKCGGADVFFDDFKIEEVSAPEDFSCQIGEPESLKLACDAAPKKWEVSRAKFNTRITASFFNLGDSAITNALGAMPIKRITQGNFRKTDFKVFKNGRPVQFAIFGDLMILNVDEITPKTESQFNIYLRSDRKNANAETSGAKQASDLPSDQIAEIRAKSDPKDFEKLFSKTRNLLVNPNFENGDQGWSYRSNSRPVVSIVEGGIFGDKAMRLKIDKSIPNYPGLQQNVPIKPDTTYIAIICAKKIGEGGGVRAPVLKISDASGKRDVREDPALKSDGEWEVQAVRLKNPYKNATASFIIVNRDKTDHIFDGAALCECINAEKFDYSTPLDLKEGQKTVAWQVNSIVKVFRFFAPPLSPAKAKISLAKNEVENLQIAVRSNVGVKGVSIVAQPPKLKGNPETSLSAPQIGVVGHVATDSVSNYLNFSHLKFYERCIPPNSMLEYYPDPILPEKSLDLPKCSTESVFITFEAGEGDASGTYEGVVEFKKEGKTIAALPYEVTVRNFAIPKESHLGAMFSYQSGDGFWGSWRAKTLEPGMRKRAYDRERVQKFMAKKRLSLDTPPRAKFSELPDGSIEGDFTKFDEFCNIALNIQKVPLLYLPIPIQMLNWARPLFPVKCAGKIIKPIDGKWPYEGMDLSKISPEFASYTKSRVECVYSHIAKKGWQNRFIFFVSDEPYYWRKPIADMLNSYCSIIRSVAPEIKLYSSTWAYTDTLKDAIDAWGLNMSAAETPKEIKNIDAQKNKIKIFTTDGNYCIDTPYNAQERIISLYCFAGGFTAYEYWGVLWNTQNPFKWAIHKDRISDSDPENIRRNRYPNGDGYFAYSAEFMGKDDIYSSVRLEAARDGQEDFEYYRILESLAQKTGDKKAAELLGKVKSLAVYPNAGGRKSAELLPDPDAFQELRDSVAAEIERLQKND